MSCFSLFNRERSLIAVEREEKKALDTEVPGKIALEQSMSEEGF